MPTITSYPRKYQPNQFGNATCLHHVSNLWRRGGRQYYDVTEPPLVGNLWSQYRGRQPMTTAPPPIDPETPAQTPAPAMHSSAGRRPWVEPAVVIAAIGVAVTIIGLLVSIALGIYGMSARIDDLGTRMDTLETRIDDLSASLSTRMETLSSRIDQVYQLLLPKQPSVPT